MRGDAGEVAAAGAVLDDDQRIEAPQEQGVHAGKIDRDDAVGLRGQELLPRRAVRRGTGSIPAACRICHTVEAAIGWPSLTSSPCPRRCPHAGFSVAMRITSLRIAASRCRSRGARAASAHSPSSSRRSSAATSPPPAAAPDAGLVRDLGAEWFISTRAGRPGPAAGGSMSASTRSAVPCVTARTACRARAAAGHPRRAPRTRS